MNAAAWILIGYFVLNIVFAAYKTGRPTKAREPLTPGVAFATVVVVACIYVLLTLLLLSAIGLV